MKKSTRPPLQSQGELRLIGGTWRGRKLTFPLLPGVRPSGSRFRETLFNWLMPWIDGARCLDLFAGSGALGLEALSRGAHSATFLDNAGPMIQNLHRNLSLLKANEASARQTDALQWLTREEALQGFDIVFVDPPFHQGLLTPVLEALQKPGILASQALIYFEAEKSLTLPPLPPGWQLHRHKSGGQVQYGLLHILPQDAS
ncbi:MAG: 16S rRNA (guanine(966)-N(2))-methyltransferase RsmD [Hahellaceae bacterium]|jgi:16S rRNA (guanine966-N2)-methyltransferase|nr:16S rRNA (guanine(966)-N(2))-methyltransferase RsmD [Hahellaceae bacterium]